MKEVMSLDKVVARMLEGYYEAKKPVTTYLKDDYIFDEDLSIKENRRLVKEHNENEDKKRSEYVNEQYRKSAEKTQDLISGIKQYSNSSLSDEKAKLVLKFIEENFNTDDLVPDDYVHIIYNIVDFVDSLANTK